jgi:hypothetical protein
MRCIECMSVAVIGRACAEDAAIAKAAAARKSFDWVIPQA